MDKPTLSGYVGRVREALAIVESLPPSSTGDCRSPLSLALTEARELQQLASWLTAHGPAMIAGITVTADGCGLRHIELTVDASGWPVARPTDGPTMFACARSSQLIGCVRAALASATAPAVLLDSIPAVERPTRFQPADAAAVLRALRSHSGSRRIT